MATYQRKQQQNTKKFSIIQLFKQAVKKAMLVFKKDEELQFPASSDFELL